MSSRKLIYIVRWCIICSLVLTLHFTYGTVETQANSLLVMTSFDRAEVWEAIQTQGLQEGVELQIHTEHLSALGPMLLNDIGAGMVPDVVEVPAEVAAQVADAYPYAVAELDPVSDVWLTQGFFPVSFNTRVIGFQTRIGQVLMFLNPPRWEDLDLLVMFMTVLAPLSIDCVYPALGNIETLHIINAVTQIDFADVQFFIDPDGETTESTLGGVLGDYLDFGANTKVYIAFSPPVPGVELVIGNWGPASMEIVFGEGSKQNLTPKSSATAPPINAFMSVRYDDPDENLEIIVIENQRSDGFLWRVCYPRIGL
jgi:hypothetical protein